MNTKQSDASESVQFLKLYKDQDKKDLFGWLNTYLNGDSSSVVEQWAISNKKDVNLFRSSYNTEVISSDIPSNYDQWINQVEDGPKFEAYINRVSSCFDYKSFVYEDNRAVCLLKGTRIFGIYNGTDKKDKRNLVQITLLSSTKSINDGAIITFDQVSLMTTKEAIDPWFNFTEEITLKKAISFGEFISNGGALEADCLHFSKSEIGVINFEQVYSSSISPLGKQ